MDVFNLLTDIDKQMIKDYVHEYVENGYQVTVDPDSSLIRWASNKNKNLGKLFGGEDLILSRPFTYTIPIDNIKEEIRYDIQHLGKASKIKDYLYSIYYQYCRDNEELSDYDKTSIVNWLVDLTSSSVLSKNKIECDKTLTINGKVIKFSYGMRPLKAIHKLFEVYYNNDAQAMQDFEKFRIWHSQKLNQRILDGTLCLSIHPLDYMTMSHNNNGWSSCMHWNDTFGEYCAGTLECMNSPYIIVAYLCSNSNKLTIGDQEWNSKKWRELFIVQNGIISEIKGYPYQDENLTNSCLMWLKELAAKNLGWTYEDKEYSINNTIKLDDDDTEEYRLSMEPTYFMYNDFGSLDKHRCRLNRKKLVCYHAEEGWHNKYIAIPYGGIATCIACGEPIEEDEDNENTVFCNKCDPVACCAICGHRLRDEDNMFYLECLDDYICGDCYDNECVIDCLTGDNFLWEDSWAVHLVVDVEDGIKVFSEGRAWDRPYYNIVTSTNEYSKVFNTLPHVYETDFDKYYYLTLDDIIDMDTAICAFGRYAIDKLISLKEEEAKDD